MLGGVKRLRIPQGKFRNRAVLSDDEIVRPCIARDCSD
jgi:hypothetical protein